MPASSDVEFARMLRASQYMCRTQLDIEMCEYTSPELRSDIELMRQCLTVDVARQYLVWLFGEPTQATPHDVLRALLEQLRPDPAAQERALHAAMKLLNPSHAEGGREALLQRLYGPLIPIEKDNIR